MKSALLVTLFTMTAGVSFAKNSKKNKIADREPAASMVAPKFSAFVDDKKLYVTVLGDSCNQVTSSFEVDALCKKDRVTRNFVVVCNAEIKVMQTLMACRDMKREAKVIEIDLEKNNVDLQAKILNLKNGETTIHVRIPHEDEKPPSY